MRLSRAITLLFTSEVAYALREPLQTGRTPSDAIVEAIEEEKVPQGRVSNLRKFFEEKAKDSSYISNPNRGILGNGMSDSQENSLSNKSPSEDNSPNEEETTEEDSEE